MEATCVATQLQPSSLHALEVTLNVVFNILEFPYAFIAYVCHLK